eukprot:9490110-Alexandrium_andersonii.AAC.1
MLCHGVLIDGRSKPMLNYCAVNQEACATSHNVARARANRVNVYANWRLAFRNPAPTHARVLARCWRKG